MASFKVFQDQYYFCWLLKTKHLLKMQEEKKLSTQGTTLLLHATEGTTTEQADFSYI